MSVGSQSAIVDDYLSALTLELPPGMGSRMSPVPHRGNAKGGGGSASASASVRGRGIGGGAGAGTSRGRVPARKEAEPTTAADLAMGSFLTSRVLASDI